MTVNKTAITSQKTQDKILNPNQQKNRRPRIPSSFISNNVKELFAILLPEEKATKNTVATPNVVGRLSPCCGCGV
jgi:hypothetical protein